MRPVIVSAADSGYFHLLQGLILSLRVQPSSRDVAVAVIDVGLSETERSWLDGERVRIVADTLPPTPPRADGKASISSAQRLRLRLPDVLPGYDVYLWMDADMWVQVDGIVPWYLRAAATGAMAITPEVHVRYRSMYGPRHWLGMLEGYGRLFDRATAERLAPNPTLNCGCFALRADAPHWQLCRDAVEAVIAKDNQFVLEQYAINYILYERSREAQAYFLPATFNWICHQAHPVVNHRTGLLCEPVPPHPPIGLLHLTMNTKWRELELRALDGATVRRSLKYRAGAY
jgi:hypothetical protein